MGVSRSLSRNGVWQMKLLQTVVGLGDDDPKQPM